MSIDVTKLPGFRWMPEFAVRPIMADGSVKDVVGTVVDVWGDAPHVPVVYWPDLKETRAHSPTGHLEVVDRPGSRGCLLHLVREAWGEPMIWTRPSDSGDQWFVEAHGAHVPIGRGPTEFAALVAALAAAPGNRGGQHE